MSISTRMKLLCCLATMLLAAGVLFFQYSERVVIDSILNQRIQEKSNILDELLRLKHDPLRKLVAGYTNWNGMVDFVSTGNVNWAQTNIDPVLESYDADLYWVFDSRGRLIHSASRLKDIATRFERPVQGVVASFSGKNLLPKQFHISVADVALELEAASIHQADDPQRTGANHGYFVVARQLDSHYFKELERLTLSTITLSRGALPPTSYANGTLILSRSFKDIADREIMRLRFQTRLAEVETLRRHNLIHLVSGMILALLFIVTSAAVISHQAALTRAKKSMDEAQQLAGIGSWERDLITGEGFWSNNCFHLMGRQPQPIAPSLEEFFTYVHDDDRAQVREALQETIRSGRDAEMEFRLAADPARIFCSKGVVACDDHGKPIRIVGSLQDITEKRGQETLREQLLKHREEFVARLSHDLKTPLTPLVALLPLIQKYAHSDKLREWTSICISSVDHMKELVVKTIKLARYSSPAQLLLKPINLDLGASVDEYVAKRHDIISRKNIRVDNRIGDQVRVHADAIELEEVFYNLISNAVKYSPPDSQVIIDASTEGKTVTVSIRDQGVGLSAEELPHIFEEFFKADSSRHELDSSGLGLSICKRIIENHNGMIWAESPGIGQGATIYFTIAAGGSA